MNSIQLQNGEVALDGLEVDVHRTEYEGLVARLETEAERSTLSDAPTCLEEVNDLLTRVRLAGFAR
jgi:hypothetical protein